MPRKKPAKKHDPTPPAPRRVVHEVLRGRKNAAHTNRRDKRAAQKQRRELEEE